MSFKILNVINHPPLTPHPSPLTPHPSPPQKAPKKAFKLLDVEDRGELETLKPQTKPHTHSKLNHTLETKPKALEKAFKLLDVEDRGEIENPKP